MCGITGTVNFDGSPVQEKVLQDMTDVIRHRGPDGEGIYVDGNVGFGHRRLAILDLSEAGKQPMASPDGRYVITYNGEIYNFGELRDELKKKSYSFRSQSDTEVLLYAYIEWGTSVLDRLNGMFAFCIWDRVKRSLFLARDRYGIKPLYYFMNNNVFMFSSEIKAFHAHPDFRPVTDRKSLLEYFTFQNIFTDRTLHQDVRLLPAGCYMKMSANRFVMTEPARYWDYSFTEPDEKNDDEEYIEELDRLFRQTITRQLVSDVDVGSYLSGGMDSGAITAIAATQLPYLKTFTCGFDMHSASGLELAFDEREKAEHMSYIFKTEHYEMVLKAGDMERIMGDLAWHIEEPRVGQSYPNYYAAKLASRFVKVVLSGTGGDEIFGGYPWRYYRTVVNDDFEHYIDKYYKYWQRLIPNKEIKKVFRPIWPDVEDVWTRDIFRDVFQEHAHSLTRPEDYINHSLYFEAKTFLHGLLVVEDKLSMTHGLETRVPFLDNDLVDFSMKLPAKMRLDNIGQVVKLNENEPGIKTEKYYNKTHDGKLALRKMMERYVPNSITKARKQGFSGPDASWFRGESIDYVKRVLFNGDARIFEYMDADSVRKLVNEHLDGKENRRLFIWSLLNVESWLEKFL